MRVGAAMVDGVVNRTFLVERGVMRSVRPCSDVTKGFGGICTGVTDCTGVTEGAVVVVDKVDGAPEGVLIGVNRSPGDVTLVTAYSLDGDSDLTNAKGGSGSPLAEVSSSGK